MGTFRLGILAFYCCALLTPVQAKEATSQYCLPTSYADPLDPIDLYDSDLLKFDIWRKDSLIGSHEVQFEKSDGRLTVAARTKIDVRVLFVPVYAYDYRSVETWCSGRLTSVQTTTIENGKERTTTAYRRGDSAMLSVASKTLQFSQEIFTTNHWNVGAVQSAELFNSVNGELSKVDIHVSQDVISVRGIERKVNRYSVTGDLVFDVWYDNSGRWLQLQFNHKGSADITLKCVQCGSSPTVG
jgi:hypothetical protein